MASHAGLYQSGGDSSQPKGSESQLLLYRWVLSYCSKGSLDSSQPEGSESKLLWKTRASPYVLAVSSSCWNRIQGQVLLLYVRGSRRGPNKCTNDCFTT
jgi:hypothetical protein